MPDGFSIDMAQVAAVVGNMQLATKRIEATTNALEADSEQRLSAWQGVAREKYYECKIQWEAAIRDMSAVLNKAGASLDTINANHANAEASNVGMW